MAFLKKYKQLITIILSLVIFVGYYIGTDPDAKIIENLPFGVQLVMIMGIFALSMAVIAFMEIHTDIYTDDLVRDQEKTVDKALEGSTGAGLLIVGKAIVLLSYAIIIAAVIISVKDII